jgi:hypothetical protein
MLLSRIGDRVRNGPKLLAYLFKVLAGGGKRVEGEEGPALAMGVG